MAICPKGYGIVNGKCTACQKDYYKPDVGRHTCTQCPLDRFNTRSKTDTIASTQCYFVSGIDRSFCFETVVQLLYIFLLVCTVMLHSYLYYFYGN